MLRYDRAIYAREVPWACYRSYAALTTVRCSFDGNRTSGVSIKHVRAPKRWLYYYSHINPHIRWSINNTRLSTRVSLAATCHSAINFCHFDVLPLRSAISWNIAHSTPLFRNVLIYQEIFENVRENISYYIYIYILHYKWLQKTLILNSTFF